MTQKKQVLWGLQAFFSIFNCQTPVHAFENYQEDGEIRLDAELDGDDIIFCVEDNGCGIHQEKIQEILSQKTSSIGVRNTNKRLQMLYGETYGVSISSQIGEGTRVFIRIPIKGDS